MQFLFISIGHKRRFTYVETRLACPTFFDNFRCTAHLFGIFLQPSSEFFSWKVLIGLCFSIQSSQRSFPLWWTAATGFSSNASSSLSFSSAPRSVGNLLQKEYLVTSYQPVSTPMSIYPDKSLDFWEVLNQYLILHTWERLETPRLDGASACAKNSSVVRSTWVWGCLYRLRQRRPNLANWKTVCNSGQGHFVIDQCMVVSMAL